MGKKSKISKEALHNGFEELNSKFVPLPPPNIPLRETPPPVSTFCLALSAPEIGVFLVSTFFGLKALGTEHDENKNTKDKTKKNEKKTLIFEL